VPEIILETRKVCKSFPGVMALENVDFQLFKGEVHILLGENGAGKSTLVKILSGALHPSSGDILINNERVSFRSPRHAIETGIGVIYQELILIPHLTAAENIFLGRETTNKIGVIKNKELLLSAQQILSGLGADIDCDVPVKSFGIAHQQMIEIAKALSLNAKILIMDEPTSALSLTETEQLFGIIRRLKERGVSIIYISHKLEELFEIGDRVTVLRDGKNTGTKKIEDTSRSELIKLMVNRELNEHFPKVNRKTGDEILRVENLSSNVLRDINFRLHKGEILGVAGLIGSGRTSLARALFGYDKISSGKIIINGKLRRINSPRKAINLGMGFLTEDRKSQGLVLTLSVKENISLPSMDSFSRLGIINFSDERKSASEYVKKLYIKTQGINQKVINLSGGNQQKVVLAKWLCSKAEIFIFDEPTKGIDIGSKEEIYQLMNQLTAEGVAIIMISSELPEILGMSDRILIMSSHRITGELSRSEASQEKIMQYALGVV